MRKHNILLIAFLLIALAACSFPAPEVPVTTSPPVIGTDSGPSATIPETLSAPPTQTERAKETVEISPTPTQASQEPTSTLEVIETLQPESEYRFAPQNGTPIGTANFLYPDAGCSWMGVGGQVFSQNDRPIGDLIVEVGGSLDGSPLLLLTMTGDSTALGPGGYEIKLADATVASHGTLWLQVHDLNGNPQSEKIYFDTYEEAGTCEKNLVIINFREIRREPIEQYLPSIFRGGQ